MNVGIQYLSSWLRGTVRPRSTASCRTPRREIARGQVWQSIRHGATLDDGGQIMAELVRELEDSELEKIRTEIGDDEWFEA